MDQARHLCGPGNSCSLASQITLGSGEASAGRTSELAASRLCDCPIRETVKNRPSGLVLHWICLTELGHSICSPRRVARLNPDQARLSEQRLRILVRQNEGGIGHSTWM